MGEMAKYAIKVALAVVVGAAMLAGLIAVISAVSGIASVGILSEMLGLIGIFMPFNMGTVFTSVGVAISALIAFITARKVYDVMINFAQSTD